MILTAIDTVFFKIQKGNFIMLKIVFGRSGYGKTEYIFNKIKEIALTSDKEILLITPEQYSLIAERRLLVDLGEDNVGKVTNSSFSRIADDAAREFGGEQLEALSKGSKAVLMLQAIERCKDKFLLFNRKIDSYSFVSSMIKIYDEMKSCNLNGKQIEILSSNIKSTALFNKLHDISLIMNSYDEIIKDRYLDPADELTRLYSRLADKQYFSNKIIFIDGFNGFVAQEYKILELIISEAKEVTITLCSDTKNPDDQHGLFAYVNNSAKILEKIALKAEIKYSYEILTENRRAESTVLSTIEKSFLCSNSSAVKNDGSVNLYAASNIADECAQVSREIRKLLRNGYKASEIAVITRDLEKYRDELSYCFKKYEIPFFYDERQPVKTQPLVVFIEYLFRCVNLSLRSDDILSLVKSGITYIDDEEINALENYVYLWNINGSKWTKPFENSTKGFVSEITESDRTELEKINSTREKIIAPVLAFRKNTKNRTAKEICEQIYYTLISFQVDKKIKENAVELSRLNHRTLAEMQGRIWDMVMDVLDGLSKILPNEPITLKEFSKLFSLVISAEDLGSLPSGLDNVQLGQADRIRTDNPKAVFVLGANEGEFPLASTGGGLLSEADRRILLENDFKLYSYGELLNIQEKYFAYMACCSSKEKLFVSYIINGKESAPSEIVLTLQNTVIGLNEKRAYDISEIDLIETKVNAFELMSEKYLTDSVFYSSLKEYFKNEPRFTAIKNLAENADVKIKDKSISKKLFENNMYVSASRIEDYYNCPFRYFCKFGLGARPREKAEINPMQRGTIIHYVLEMILSDYGSKKLSTMPKFEIKSAVDKYIDEYLSREMGNTKDISVRFSYNFKRLSKLIYSVVFHLSQEFKNCDFEAKAFELDIDRDGSVKPEILPLKDGGSIQIRGSIDRVDTYEKNGETYVRVVDYKSGNKSFNLSDVYYGLNLQMFVYLFSLCTDKSAKLTGTPAGVLYMHSAREIFSFDSKKDVSSNIAGEETKSFKMKGIVIDEDNGEIALAMEHSLLGKFIPVEYKTNGDLKGSLASLAQFGLIHKKVNELIIQMGNELHNGNISQSPVKNKSHKTTCDFCDYSDVCANKRSIEYRITEELSDNDVKNALEKEFNENGE